MNFNLFYKKTLILVLAAVCCSFTERATADTPVAVQNVTVTGTNAPVAVQNITVTGTVTDTYGEPMPGVNVVVKGTTLGSISDFNGKYSISVPGRDAVLVFSYIGYKVQEMVVGNRTAIDVIMEEDTREIEEVVVVGYGTQKKINLTGSVQHVTSAELTKRSTSNASVALQGLIPGVSVVQSTGQPGADGASITIRGTGSFRSSTSPLVLIDGVEGDINNIELNAIESISVLKDAASASIYGSRAANGVILVTTKRSKEEKVRITYNGYVGTNRPTNLPDAVDAIGYMEAINTARANAGLDDQYSPEWINQYKTQGADNMTRYDTNWRELLIKDAAFLQNHSLSLSGGSQQISYFANAGYYFQDGQIPNNNYSRMTLRMNTDARITRWLTLGLDLNIRQSKAKRPSQQEPKTLINMGTTYSPIFSGVNADGTWGFGQNGVNPVAIAKAGGIHEGVTPDLGIKGFLRLTPFDGFEALASYSSRRQEYKVNSFIRQYDTYEGGVFRTTWPSTGQTGTESWNQTNWNQFNAQVSYVTSVAKHSLSGLAGMQTEEMINRWVGTSRTGFDFPGFEEIKHGDVASATNYSGHEEWAMVSFFGRINYAYANRYLLELNGRWDASSRFMSDNRWGFFPSVSAGWRISEEAFFEPARNTVNNLKIRASYGTLGNQAITRDDDSNSYYPYMAMLNIQGYGYRFNKELGNGVAQTEMANPLITWEKSTQTNVGMDIGMLRSRLNLTFDYYVRNIHDMLQRLPVPSYVGLSPAFKNAGSMRNKGWDLAIGWHDKTGGFGYSISGNLSDVKNEVIDLQGEKYINPTNTVQEGYPIWAWYGYVSDGYFQSQTEIDNTPAVYGGNKANIKPGYVRYKDISGEDGKPDNVINDKDMTIIGDPFPRYQFGLSLGADWKGFDFTLFMQGVGKKDILHTGSGARPFHVGRTVFKHQLDTWTPDNPHAAYPLLLIEGTDGSNPNNIVSDFWIRSGAYMRVKNVVIGYTLPASLFNTVNIEHVRFYVSGQNLLTLCKAYKGYDPENDVSNGNFYPLMQTFTFGIDIRF